ncbi:Alpha-N-arabinofuranosidase [Ignisphaera aggregans DSM 17230]|uniref:non-reducing end alpha-L-arabinofuranosidase n=1 Tax=Ignisphaera aggregans (strain DSM 17230 / JCM 13409 / AQ1.S1) TaxID=583356 RepID=E0SNU3_IGNAA|nr:Alpha-N-arabinofuranosidase [Ignisphaera aggregans DSM 17230]
MFRGSIFVDPFISIGRISRRIYGHFIEHWGRCIYGGIWVGPNSSIPNINGFRKDVIEAVRGIRASIVRWPGGNFSSQYHWLDGIGPRENRPRKLNLAWITKEGAEIEINEFGTDEYIEWVRLIGAEPFIVVNMGNGSPEEAANWVEYCNSSKDTYFARLRVKYGHREPYNVKIWGLGNEQWGWWQVGFTLSGEEYGRRALEFANEMKRVDPSIELVAVGHDEDMEWNIDMLKMLKDYIDYLSIHTYIWPENYSYEDFVATSLLIEDKIRAVYSTIVYAKNRYGIKKDIKIAYDEWNVWYPEARDYPYIQITSVKDAVWTALFLNTLHKYSDHVKIANFAQLVNSIALIIARDDGSLLLTPQYLVFKLYTMHNARDVVKTVVESPSYISEKLGKVVDYIDVSTLREDNILYIYIVNRSRDEEAEIDVHIKNLTPKAVEHLYIAGRSIDDKNTFDNPNNVEIENNKEFSILGNTINVKLKPHSINMLKIYT